MYATSPAVRNRGWGPCLAASQRTNRCAAASSAHAETVEIASAANDAETKTCSRDCGRAIGRNTPRASQKCSPTLQPDKTSHDRPIARDVMGYTFVVFLALLPVVLILVTVLGMTLPYPL